MDNDLKKLHNLLVKIERRGDGKKSIDDTDITTKLISGLKESNERLRRIENLLKTINSTTKTLQSNNIEIGKERDK